jgi:hypothetical protein
MSFNLINAARTISVGPDDYNLVFDVTGNSGHSIPDGYYFVNNCNLDGYHKHGKKDENSGGLP